MKVSHPPSSLPVSPASTSSALCRICYDGSGEELISPCACAGSVAKVHTSCLEKWLTTSNRNCCEICFYPYRTKRYSKPIYQWLFSGQMSPSLLSDTICFLLLTPLCFVSIYLCCVAAVTYAFKGQWQCGALSFLSVVVGATYLIWAILTIRFHLRRLRMWRRSNQIVHLDPQWRWREEGIGRIVVDRI